MTDPIKLSIMGAAIGILYVGGPNGFPAAIIFYFIANTAWNRLGGWPEGWYRIIGTDYLQDYIIGPTGKIERPYIKLKDLETHSPAKFTFTTQGAKKEGDFFLGDNNCKFSNPKNAPAYLHTFDDARPIPVWNRDTPRMDATLVHAGYKNDILERRHRLNQQPQRLKWGILGFIIILCLVFSFAAAYYSILYGLNANCALHTKACP